jgi:hypothetical protein
VRVSDGGFAFPLRRIYDVAFWRDGAHCAKPARAGRLQEHASP